MRRLTLIILLVLLITACQRSPGSTPVPTESSAGEGQEAATEAADVDDNAGSDVEERGEDASSDAPFSDSADLRAARFAVVYHMTEIEGMTFPLVDEWAPESLSEDDEFRTYTFQSGEWTLSLASPQEDTPDLLYRVRITGPDDFTYLAEMSEQGNLAPAQ